MSRFDDAVRAWYGEWVARGMTQRPTVIDMGDGLFSVSIRGPDLGGSHELGVPSSPAAIGPGEGAPLVETPDDASSGIRNLQIASSEIATTPHRYVELNCRCAGENAGEFRNLSVGYESEQRRCDGGSVALVTGERCPQVFRTYINALQRCGVLSDSDFSRPDITHGTPAYMHSLVSQVSDETVERWITAWHMPEGSTREDLSERVLEHGRGDETTPDEARELAAAIMADIGPERIDGARRADRSIVARHHDPDTAADLDYHDGTKEPIEDSEWFRDLALAAEKRQEQDD